MYITINKDSVFNKIYINSHHHKKRKKKVKGEKSAGEAVKCPWLFTLKRGRVKQTVCQNKMLSYKFAPFCSKSRVKH